MDEWIRLVPGELAIDAVSLRNIAVAGRDGFELAGEKLIEFVRRNILLLLAKGAKPVVGAKDDDDYWSLVDYGDAPEAIANAIISEWQCDGREPELGGVSFALPDICEATIPPEVKAEIRKWKLQR